MLDNSSELALAPTLGETVLVQHEGRVGAIRPDTLLLDRAIINPALAALGVTANAPAPAVDAVIALDQFGERLLGCGVEAANRIGHSPPVSSWHARAAPAGQNQPGGRWARQK